MNIYLDIEKLLEYAQTHLLLDDLDVIYARNLILAELKLSDYVQYEVNDEEIDALNNPEALLTPIVAYAAENGAVLVKNKAKLAARLMAIVSKRPSEVIDLYFELADTNPQKAVAFLEDYLLKSAGTNESFIREQCGVSGKSKKSKAEKADETPGVEVAGIEYLLSYAKAHLLLDELDVPDARANILDALKITNYVVAEIDADTAYELSVPDAVLNQVISYALETSVIKEADKMDFSDKIMGFVVKRPSEITDIFFSLHAKNPAKAFEWLYDYAIKSNYVNLTAVAANRHWEAKGTKGRIEVTVNLARPEKSDKEVEKSVLDKTGKYPLCQLCKENEGYVGKTMIRRTLRTIPLTLGGEDYFWQYSPYSYFNQHGIAISAEHTPMKIDRATLGKLLDFVNFMPSYFIGSNATLPRIGGSVLAHDHFQGGKPVMPMFRAPIAKKLKSSEHPYIKIELLDWYCPVIRISYTNAERLADFANIIRKAWEHYSDESIGLVAKTGEVQHNGIAPVARKLPDGSYCFDIILRNNRTSEEFPDGIFAAHPQNRPIKSEAIGLTEAMGWFILPGRLAQQLARIEKFLTKEVRFSAARVDEDLAMFVPMIEKLIKEAGSGKLSGKEAELNVKDEVNRMCENTLSDIAVFKKDDAGQTALAEFLKTAGIEML